MRLPRDWSGKDLAVKLRVMGYLVVRQTGSHIRLTTLSHGEHHITIPAHDSLRAGTLNAILSQIGAHFELTRDELINKLLNE